MLVGVAPFGLVAGATPVTHGMTWDVAVGFSVVVFAGASQLVALDVLAGGGSVLVAVVAACAINLRMVLYSASLAPYLSRTSMVRRLAMSYLLTDQVYALSILRLTGEGSVGPSSGSAPVESSGGAPVESSGGDAAGNAPEAPRITGTGEGLLSEGGLWWFFLGGGLALWVTWQISTVVGVLVGTAIPAGMHLEFAVPLVFLVLLVPTLVDAPALVAAAVGGGVAVAAAGLGAGPTSIVIGSVAGVVAGAVVDRDEVDRDEVDRDEVDRDEVDRDEVDRDEGDM